MPTPPAQQTTTKLVVADSTLDPHDPSRPRLRKPEEQSFLSWKFSETERLVKAALATQDSEKALYIITKGALSFGSSDIHYDYTDSGVSVRMRIDGNLSTIFPLTKREYSLIMERIKYNSGLKLNITNIPQEGKYRIQDDTSLLDVRISTIPVKGWENIVCRLLDSTNAIPEFANLGFMWTSKRQIDQCLRKKQGMILVTGPTGSGKTTTLYSILTTLNTPNKKVITLEDPVEYSLAWVVQSEVNEKTGYTYTTGLKALLRQDPDIIMIGEIRDIDTAQIATQASLTGHLVLSTLHTKSSTESLERLMNIGLEPYIIASALDIIIAQRLVRRICPDCTESYLADANQTDVIRWMMKDIGIEAVNRAKKDGFVLHRGRGCERCGGTGYRGRIGVYEVFSFNDAIRAVVRRGASPAEVLAEARKYDFILMREDGIMKAMRGKTTLDELFSIIEM